MTGTKATFTSETLPIRSGWAGARDRTILRNIKSLRRSSERHELDGVSRAVLYAVAATGPAIVRGGYLAHHLGVSVPESDRLVSEAVAHGLLAPGSASRRLDLMSADFLAFLDLAEYGIGPEHRDDAPPSGSYAELPAVNLTASFAGRPTRDESP